MRFFTFNRWILVSCIVLLSSQRVHMYHPRSFPTFALPTSAIESGAGRDEAGLSLSLSPPKSLGQPYNQEKSKEANRKRTLRELFPAGQEEALKRPVVRPQYEAPSDIIACYGQKQPTKVSGKRQLHLVEDFRPLYVPTHVSGYLGIDEYAQSGTSFQLSAKSKGIPMKLHENFTNGYSTETSTSTHKEGGYKTCYQAKKGSLPNLTHQKQPLPTQEVNHIHHFHSTMTPENQILPVLGVGSLTESCLSQRPHQLEGYPSLLLAWNPGKIFAKIAHGAEILAQDLSEGLPSAFAFPKTSLRETSEKRPNELLLPFTYDLIVKGINEKQWIKVRLISRIFWETWEEVEQKKEVLPIPLFLWFYEFICESIIPGLFSRSDTSRTVFRESINQIKRETKYAGRCFHLEQLIKFLSVGDEKVFRLHQNFRSVAIAQLLDTGLRECAEAEILALSKNQDIHQGILEKLELVGNSIRATGTKAWELYVQTTWSSGNGWERTIKSYFFKNFDSTKRTQEIFLVDNFMNPHCSVPDQEKLYEILSENITEDIVPISLKLKNPPSNPDQMLKEFGMAEYLSRYQGKKISGPFLPGRMHHFFEHWKNKEQRGILDIGQ